MKIAEDEEVPLHSPSTMMPQRQSRNGPGRLNSNQSQATFTQDNVLNFQQKVVVEENQDDKKVFKIQKVDNSYDLLVLIAETM